MMPSPRPGHVSAGFVSSEPSHTTKLELKLISFVFAKWLPRRLRGNHGSIVTFANKINITTITE
jgi:hypothetical protein